MPYVLPIRKYKNVLGRKHIGASATTVDSPVGSVSRLAKYDKRDARIALCIDGERL